MRTYLFVVPQQASVNHHDFKDKLIAENVKILKREEFPATAFLSVKDLIGDPNVHLSDSLCAKLVPRNDCNVLKREPVLDEHGTQRHIKAELLWHYSWGDQDISSLPQDLLEAMAWDLHDHPNFVHLCVVDDTPEKVLDESEEEEYDSSSNDESPVETAENEEHHE